MNMMEFVKLFRKVDILESNDNMLLDLCKGLVKNQKRLNSMILLVGIDLACIWLYNHMTDRQIKDLQERVHELEAKNSYMEANAEAACAPDEIDDDDIMR